MEKPKSVVVGQGKCLACGSARPVKAMSNGHLSVKCAGDDGWCHDGMSRSDATDAIYARNVTKWVRPEYRRAYLGADPPPKKALKPVPGKTPPAPAPVIEDEGGLFG
jgi:hypothetical protein